MNAKQKEEIIRIIKSDCKTRRVYIDCDGNTCAIGALAVAAGLTLPSPGAVSQSNLIRYYDELASPLMAAYGLDRYDLQMIQSLNDDYGTPKDRQNAILLYIDSLEIEVTK